jgi:hypothetical protein
VPGAANSFGQLNPSQAILAGQTFVAPAFTRLDEFRFHLGNLRSFPLVGYHAFVAAFDAVTERVAGPILFQSALTQGTDPFTPTLTTFTTGGIAVTPGQRYIAFLGAPGLAGSSEQRSGAVFRTVGDTYAGGEARMAVAYNGTLPSILEARFTPVGDDFAFAATFSQPAVATVPEPGTAALLAGGLLGTALVARRRRAARGGAGPAPDAPQARLARTRP